MTEKGPKYKFSFTAGALLSREFDLVINAINDFNAFIDGSEKVDPKILAVNAETAQIRYLSEVKNRIFELTPSLLENYASLDDDDRKVIQFYSVCKRYHLVRDFMLEVVRDKWMNLDLNISTDDFELFMFKKMDLHHELEAISEKTRYKLSQVTLKMLKELGMLNKKQLTKLANSTAIAQIFETGDTWFLDVMLLNDEEKSAYYD